MSVDSEYNSIPIILLRTTLHLFFHLGMFALCFERMRMLLTYPHENLLGTPLADGSDHSVSTPSRNTSTFRQDRERRVSMASLQVPSQAIGSQEFVSRTFKL